jgi:SAM-dependent methyltransferase
MAERTEAETYATVQACRGCNRAAGSWDIVFEMEPMPLAGYFPSSLGDAEGAERFPLTWIRCAYCGLVQVLEDIDDARLYGQYSYGSSTVPGLVRHFEAYSAFLANRLGDGPRTVLEIGSNDGVLLSRLPAPWTRIGVDPSDIARARPGHNYRLINEPFGHKVAENLPERGQVDLVTSSNAMAHFTNLREAIEAAHAVLAPGGEFFVEVHDLDSTLSTGQWDTVYHEHKAEWSERSLSACVGEVGFVPVYLERLSLHGGLLRAGFRKASKAAHKIARPARESFRTLVTSYRTRKESDAARSLVALRDDGARIAAYGAAGRANVWLNQMRDLSFEWIVDDSPHRAGRWIPAVAVPIVPPERLDADPPDACLITAWNHAADIRVRHPKFAGRWLQTFNPDGAGAS